ncbi:DUF397 domain-containing protein [Sphaerisporangium aureirubrum]|uniref:DUF397 domain-containing protein n=1 Tax=Sphaerisporangium aureirubrum TaxID=1544736 RepID=A0ABW1N7N6_9ACTN
MDLNAAQWRKSSRSGSNGAQCVEVADNLPGVVAVRDSKMSDSPLITVEPGEWRSFLSLLKVG